MLRQLRCAAPALALSPLARRPPACGLAGVRRSDEALAFFVKREGDAGFAEVTVPTGVSVAALVKAAVAKLRIDASPSTVTLTLAAAAPGSPPLDSRLSLKSAIAEGVLSPRADLLVTLHPPPLPPLPPLSTYTGVIARRPLPLNSTALAALAAESTPPHARLAALSALVTELVALDPNALGPGVPLPLLRTKAHVALVSVLSSQARMLAAGVFLGINGLPCRTLIGARGIGKTAVLRAFCAVAPSAFPSLAVLYVTGEGVSDSSSAFRSAHLRELVEASIAERKDAGAHGAPRSRGGDINVALDAARLRSLIVLDEFDELYRVPDTNTELVLNVNMTLGTLATLGGSTDGRFGVFLCGSSAATPRLVCGDGKHLADLFPLVSHGIPNLNSQKFKPLRILSAPCSAVNEVADMLTVLSHRSKLPRSALPSARLITFFVGSSPRAVAAAIAASVASVSDSVRLSARTRTVAATSGLAAAIGSGSLAMSPVSLHAEALYGALLARFVVANSQLRSLIGSGSAAAQLTALLNEAQPWEEAVTPLALSDAVAAWEAVAVSSLNSLALAHDSAYIMRLLDELADNYYVRIVRDDFSIEGEIWPMTASQVVFAGGGRSTAAAILKASATVLTPIARLLVSSTATLILPSVLVR